MSNLPSLPTTAQLPQTPATPVIPTLPGPCIALPNPPPIPQVPLNLGLTVPTITPPNLGVYCCTLPPIPTPPLPSFLGFGLGEPGVVQSLRAILAAIREYEDSFPLVCPRE